MLNFTWRGKGLPYYFYTVWGVTFTIWKTGTSAQSPFSIGNGRIAWFWRIPTDGFAAAVF